MTTLIICSKGWDWCKCYDCLRKLAKNLLLYWITSSKVIPLKLEMCLYFHRNEKVICKPVSRHLIPPSFAYPRTGSKQMFSIAVLSPISLSNLAESVFLQAARPFSNLILSRSYFHQWCQSKRAFVCIFH